MREKILVDPEKIDWQPIEQLPSGAWIKMLSHDKESGAFSALFKFDKGFEEPRHSHPSDHDIFILEGSLVDSDGIETKKGMFFYAPAGDEHGPFTAPDGCIFYGFFNGPPF